MDAQESHGFGAGSIHLSFWALEDPVCFCPWHPRDADLLCLPSAEDTGLSSVPTVMGGSHPPVPPEANVV